MRSTDIKRAAIAFLFSCLFFAISGCEESLDEKVGNMMDKVKDEVNEQTGKVLDEVKGQLVESVINNMDEIDELKKALKEELTDEKREELSKKVGNLREGLSSFYKAIEDESTESWDEVDKKLKSAEKAIKDGAVDGVEGLAELEEAIKMVRETLLEKLKS